jgi:uncharacterized membrane protein
VKLRTAGLHPKVPAQAITGLIVGALAYYGVDLDPEVAGGIAAVAGVVAGLLAPAVPALPVVAKRIDGEAGQGLVQTLLIIALVLFIIALVVWLLAH